MHEPIESGCKSQPLSAGQLTAQHNGKNVRVDGQPVSVLLESIPLQGGYVKLVLAYRGAVANYVVNRDVPVQLDAPQEVTGD